MAESARSFAARVNRHTGLSLAQIPNGTETEVMEGSIICSSPHGQLVFTNHSHQDDDGYDIYTTAVLWNRGEELPPAKEGATGNMSV